MPKEFDKITQYLVVPIQGEATERTVKCQYFRVHHGHWISVTPDELRTHGQDIVCLRQPPYEEASKHVPNVDPCLHLFAGVAKTRNANRSIPNLMQVIDGALVVSAYPQTSRSLILIFQRHTSEFEFGELVATTDPDVKNDPNDINGCLPG